MKQKELVNFMAEAMHYAQEHCGDPQEWAMDKENRAKRFACCSYQVACFLAQNTRNGSGGVEWEVILDDLCGTKPSPVKSIAQWRRILQGLAAVLGGWKP